MNMHMAVNLIVMWIPDSLAYLDVLSYTLREVYELMDYCFQLLYSDLFLSTKLIRLKKKGEALPFIVENPVHFICSFCIVHVYNRAEISVVISSIF